MLGKLREKYLKSKGSPKHKIKLKQKKINCLYKTTNITKFKKEQIPFDNAYCGNSFQALFSPRLIRKRYFTNKKGKHWNRSWLSSINTGYVFRRLFEGALFAKINKQYI